MASKLFWLCADTRAAKHTDYRGFGLLVDWQQKKIVKRFDVPILFDDSMPEGQISRDCRGVRQVRTIDGRLHVLTHGGQLVLDPESLKIVDQVTHPWHIGGHYLVPDGEHVWYNAGVQDAVVKLSRDGVIQQIIHLCDCDELIEHLPIRRYRHDEQADFREKTRDWILSEKKAGRVDQLHINTLQVHESKLYGFSCTYGALFQIHPEVRLVFRDDTLVHPHDGQFFTSERLIVNDSENSRVIVYDARNHERIREIEIPIPDTKGDDPKHAQRGFVRGLAKVDESHVVVGSAPLSMYEVDVERGEVVAQMSFSDDPAVTSHGICAA